MTFFRVFTEVVQKCFKKVEILTCFLTNAPEAEFYHHAGAKPIKHASGLCPFYFE